MLKLLRCRRTDARKTAAKLNLMELFTFPSQAQAVVLRAAQRVLMQFERLKSSELIESLGGSLIDRPTLARHYQGVFVRESQVRPPEGSQLRSPT